MILKMPLGHQDLPQQGKADQEKEDETAINLHQSLEK
jgi:hypothetical protein